MPWKREWEGCKSRRQGEGAVKRHLLDMLWHYSHISQQLWLHTLGLHKTGPVNTGLSHPLLNYWLLMDSGWGVIPCLQLCSWGWTQGLWWIVPALVNQSWLKVMGHTTKQKERKMGERTCWGPWYSGRIGLCEGKQKAFYSCTKL